MYLVNIEVLEVDLFPVGGVAYAWEIILQEVAFSSLPASTKPTVKHTVVNIEEERP